MERVDMQSEPRFKDKCGHSKECYIGTGSYSRMIDGKPEECWIDVYVFDDPTFGQEVCIRYGKKPEEYLSPGQVCTFLLHVGKTNETYRHAWDIMRANGKVEYRKA